MSVEALAVALHHSRAEGAAKLVLLGIANHDGDGGAWPSIATLARYAHVSQRNVQKALARLEELREIRREMNAGGNHLTPGHARPNLYHFLLSCPPACDGTRNHRMLDRLEPLLSTGVSVATGGVGSDTGGVSVATPEPSTNPLQDSERPTRVTARASACPEDHHGNHRYGPGGFCTNGCGIELGAVA